MITFPLLLSVIAKMQNTICAFLLSCPVRGTWIEIPMRMVCYKSRLSCPVRGTWIEIYIIMILTKFNLCRAPYGARGLKCGVLRQMETLDKVVPRTGHVD